MSDLVPIEQKEVDFYGDEVTAVLIKDHVYASVTNLCDALGLDAQGQRRRIDRHSVLSKGLMVAKVSTIKTDGATR
ncbi:MAG: phage antirepressor N-terminal domain-containing protein [Chloroflexota bacterium]